MLHPDFVYEWTEMHFSMLLIKSLIFCVDLTQGIEDCYNLSKIDFQDNRNTNSSPRLRFLNNV